MAKIIYTRTDEAPLLATYSLKPIIEAFATSAGVEVETQRHLACRTRAGTVQ
jgi:isocitrate dehydrogenase